VLRIDAAASTVCAATVSRMTVLTVISLSTLDMTSASGSEPTRRRGCAAQRRSSTNPDRVRAICPPRSARRPSCPGKRRRRPTSSTPCSTRCPSRHGLTRRCEGSPAHRGSPGTTSRIGVRLLDVRRSSSMTAHERPTPTAARSQGSQTKRPPADAGGRLTWSGPLF
jgi:hypothetical protein